MTRELVETGASLLNLNLFVRREVVQKVLGEHQVFLSKIMANPCFQPQDVLVPSQAEAWSWITSRQSCFWSPRRSQNYWWTRQLLATGETEMVSNAAVRSLHLSLAFNWFPSEREIDSPRFGSNCYDPRGPVFFRLGRLVYRVTLSFITTEMFAFPMFLASLNFVTAETLAFFAWRSLVTPIFPWNHHQSRGPPSQAARCLVWRTVPGLLGCSASRAGF